MEHKTFSVPNIGCDGCVNAIQNELNELPGVSKVKGNSQTKIVTVEWSTPTTWEEIKNTLAEIEYSPANE